MAPEESFCVICFRTVSLITPQLKQWHPIKRRRGRPRTRCLKATLTKFLTELDHHHHLQSIKKEGEGDENCSGPKFEPVDFEDVVVCQACKITIQKSFDLREKAKEKEKVVYSLQRQLLDELRMLEGYMKEGGGNMKKLEGRVKKTSKKFLKRAKEGEGWQEKTERVREAILKGGPKFPFFRASSPSGGDVEEDNPKAEEGEGLKGGCASSSTRTRRKGRKRSRSRKRVKSEEEQGLGEVIEMKIKEEPLDEPEFDEESPEDEGALAPCEVEDNSRCSMGSEEDETVEGRGTSRSDDSDEDWKVGGASETSGSESESEVASESDWDDKDNPDASQKMSRAEAGGSKQKRIDWEKELNEFLTESGISLEGMSEVRRSFILGTVKHMIGMRGRRRRGKVVTENDPDDDFWFKKMYKLEYTAQQGFSLGGVVIRMNEDAWRFECSKCEYHLAIPKSGTFEGARCVWRYRLRNHVFAQHLDFYRCRICNDGTRFKNERRYTLHMQWHREGDRSYIASTCDICGKVLADSKYLVPHKFTHMNAEEKEEARRNGTYRGVAPKKLLDPVKNRCHICGARNYLRVHLETIHKDKEERKDRVQCEDCGRTMNRSNYLTYHKKFGCPKLEKGPKMPCLQCGKTFQTSQGLKLHMVCSHSEETPYQCEVCGKAFKTRAKCTNHSRSTGRNGSLSVVGVGRRLSISQV